jgi:hypothetical protein
MQRRLHDQASPEALAVVRIGVFGLWVIYLAACDLTRFSDLPLEWFHPRGFFRLANRDMILIALSAPVLNAIYCFAWFGCVAVIFGVRPYLPLALATWAALMFVDAVSKGFQGYVNHGQLVMLFAALILAVFPAGDSMSIFRRRASQPPNLYAAAMYACAMALCIPYMFIGVRRIFTGGIDIFMDDSIANYIVEKSMRYSAFTFDHGLSLIGRPWLILGAKIGFVVITVFEICSPLCLVSTSFRRCWVLVMLPFHVMVLLTMRISFGENMVLIVLLLTAFPYWITAQLLGADHIGASLFTNCRSLVGAAAGLK